MSRPFDPLFNGRFQIDISGVNVAAFVACDGLEVAIDVIRYADGNAAGGIERKRPGRARVANIVLRRGQTASNDLWQWFKAVMDGQVDRKDISIVVLHDDGSEALRYNVFEAWPCRWKGLDLDAVRPAALIEELELAVERIERG